MMIGFWVAVFLVGMLATVYGLYEKGKEVGRREHRGADFARPCSITEA